MLLCHFLQFENKLVYLKQQRVLGPFTNWRFFFDEKLALGRTIKHSYSHTHINSNEPITAGRLPPLPLPADLAFAARDQWCQSFM